MGTLSGGQLRVLPSDGMGISCPASEPARPSTHKDQLKNAQAAYAKEVGMGNPAEET